MIKTIRISEELLNELKSYLKKEGLNRNVSDEITKLLNEEYLKSREKEVKEKLKKLYNI